MNADCPESIPNLQNGELGANGEVKPLNKIKEENKEDDFCTEDQNDFAKLTIANLTATLNLDCKIDLNRVKLLRNSYYAPGLFPAVRMRIKNPKATALIFGNGKIICTGTNSIEDSKKACKIYARIIQNLGYSVKFKDYTIQNLVACHRHPFCVDISKLYEEIQYIPQYMGSIYCSSIFPGLKFVTGIGKISAKIFMNGKIIITGAKNMETAQKAFEVIYPFMKKYTKSFIDRKQN